MNYVLQERQKKAVRLIVSDFDGTLMPFGDSCVAKEVKNRIYKALDMGVKVAVSSGRTYGELVYFLPELANELYFVCCDGAYYVKGQKLLYEKKIAERDMAYVCGVSGGTVLHGAFCNYGIGRLPTEADCFEAVRISDIGSLKERIFKMTAYGTKCLLPSDSGLRLHWDGGKNQVTQLVNRFANKGAALSDLQTRLMVSGFDTAALGDSDNDLPMLKGARYAFAVGKKLSSPAITNINDAIEAFDALGVK